MWKLLTGVFIFLFFINTAFCYTIDNDSVIFEDSQASLRVTPHTATSPVKKFKQTFEVCNKTGVDSPIFIGYIFNFPLKAGEVLYWRKPVYDWVEKTKTCDYNFNYILNEDTDRNPHRAFCFQTVDVNGVDTNTVFWEHEFKSGSIPTKTIYWDENTLVSGNNWANVTDAFKTNHREHNGKHIYPYTAGKLIKANSCEKWRLNYTPADADNTKKWDLWLWSGSNWGCILDDSCTKTLKLDPWWNSDYNTSKYLNIKCTSQNCDFNSTFFFQLDTSSLISDGKMQNDCDDLRIVKTTDNTEIDRTIEGCNTADTNVFFRNTLGIIQNTDFNSNDANGYKLYYGNFSAASPPNNRNLVFQVYDSSFESTSSPFWYNHDTDPDISSSRDDTGYDDGSYHWRLNGACSGPGNCSAGYRQSYDMDWSLISYIRYNVSCALYDEDAAEVYYCTGCPTQQTSEKICSGSDVVDHYNHAKDVSSITENGRLYFYLLLYGGDSGNLHFDEVTTWIDADIFLGAEEKVDITPDVNIMGDLNGTCINSSCLIKGGTDHNVWFSVSDADNNASDFLVDFNISLVNAVGTGTVVFADLNLATDFNSPEQDTNFLGYGFDVNFYWLYTMPLLDANYFACINLKDTVNDINVGKCASLSFLVDSTKPQTVVKDFNANWSRFPAIINLSCSDNNSGCDKTYYSIDSNTFSEFSSSFTISWEGSTSLRIYSNDNAGNEEDVNQLYILIDLNSPTYISVVPDSNSTTNDSTPTIQFEVTDVYSGVSMCYWTAFQDDAFVEYASSSPFLDVCSYTCSELAENQSCFADLNISDAAGNVSPKFRSAAYIYQASSGVSGGTGPGGGGAPPTLPPIKVTVPSLIEVTPSTRVISLFKGETERYKLIITSLSDSELAIVITIPEDAAPFFNETLTSVTLEPRETKVFEYLVKMPEDVNSFAPFDTNITIDIEAGQEKLNIDITLQQETSIFGFFSSDIFGIGLPVLGIIVLIAILFFVWRSL